MKFWCASTWMDPVAMIGISSVLDEAGYHGLMASDHLVYPRDLRSRYPYSPHPDGRPVWEADAIWPDPWVFLGAVAAVTRRLQLSTNVYVAPLRTIVDVAKIVGTASVISGGRVALGAGAGWMREEFELEGQDYDSRGRRLAEMIVGLRELWKGGWVEFHGEHYEVPPLTIEPHPAVPVPIYVGGHSDAALRRAARLGDGWIGGAYGWDELASITARLRTLLAEAGRSDEPFEVIAAIMEYPSADLYRRGEDELGLTATLCLPWFADADIAAQRAAGVEPPTAAYRASIERFAEEIVDPCR
jgi:probable F420-dependent oxidoreductase